RRSKKELQAEIHRLRELHGDGLKVFPPKSKWMLSITIGYKHDGKPDEHRFYFDTQKEAATKQAALINGTDPLVAPPEETPSGQLESADAPNAPTLGQWLDMW